MTSINRSKPVLVFLANGVQGAAVMRAAQRQGLGVRALVRNPSPMNLSPDSMIETVQGDLDDAMSLHAASRHVDHAVLQIPIGPLDEMRRRAVNAMTALASAGVRSLVLKLASASRPEPCEEPSFIANAVIERIIRDAMIPFSIVRPTMYLDNLLKPSARADIVTHGVFAPPIDAKQRIAWTSADDCADAAIRLLSQGVDGRDHRIAGPESLTGDELAARLSAGLGRAIRYCAQPIDDFERDIDQVMGPGVGSRVASKFRYFADHADEADAILARPYEQNGPAGFQPTTVDNWARAHRDQFFGGV